MGHLLVELLGQAALQVLVVLLDLVVGVVLGRLHRFRGVLLGITVLARVEKNVVVVEEDRVRPSDEEEDLRRALLDIATTCLENWARTDSSPPPPGSEEQGTPLSLASTFTKNHSSFGQKTTIKSCNSFSLSVLIMERAKSNKSTLSIMGSL